MPLQTEFTNYEEIASSMNSAIFGSNPMIFGYASFNDSGAYYWTYSGFDFLSPSKVATIAGEDPPQYQIEFNEWMKTLVSFHPLKNQAA